MMKTSTLVALSLMSSGMAAFAAAPVVYPTPQKANIADHYSAFKGISMVVRGASAEDKPIWKNPPADRNAGAYLDGVPEKSGAYCLQVKNGVVRVGAHDARGLFYAKQTLSQLLKDVPNASFAQKDPFEGKDIAQVAALGKLADADITDWPDLANRGTVEGFYGTPWSHASRIKQLEFYGRNKMNTYIYGPKDDPYHSAKWREPYPDNEAKQIRELVQVAKKNHVDFVWAIHPGGSIKWTPEDMGRVLKKCELMYDMGVRHFSVFFDDIGGEGTNPARQAELLNMLHKDLVVAKGDVGPLVMCPTQYNRAWANGDYLPLLGRELDPSTHIMWTGNSVVHDITQEGQDWIQGQLGRPSYIWWNFPVTDFVRNHLTLGRVYGLTQEDKAAPSMSGFVSNPMDKPEASKFTLFSIGDYAWNIKGFKSETSWKDGLKRLFPDCAAAAQVFANHNSDLGANGHGYRREESVEFAPIAESVLKQVKETGKVDDKTAAAWAKEFAQIAAAPAMIIAKGGSTALNEEIMPWLLSFAELGKAGAAVLPALQAGDPASFVVVSSALDEMDRLSKSNNNNPHQPGIKTGSLVLMPAVTALADQAAGALYTKIAGRPAMTATPIAQGGKDDGRDAWTDNNPQSFWHSGAYQSVGDWYGLDYGAPIAMKSIDLLMGRNESDGDYVAKGQLEVSQNMQDWKPLGPETAGKRVVWQGKKPVFARGVRYRVTEAKYAGDNKQGNTVWTAIAEFSVNKPLPAQAKSTVKGLEGLMAQEGEKLVGINRVMEVSTMQPGDTISLILPAAVDATWLEIDLDQPDLDKWGEVTVLTEGSSNPVAQKIHKWQGNKYTAQGDQVAKKIKQVTFTNKGDTPKEIKVNMFKLDVPPVDNTKSTVSLTDGNLMTVYRCDLPLDLTVENTDVPAAKKLVVVGNADYALQIQAKDGSWSPIVKSAGGAGAQSYKLPANNTKAIRLRYTKPQVGKSINEVMFLP